MKFEDYLRERAEKDMEAILTERDRQFIQQLMLKFELEEKPEPNDTGKRRKRVKNKRR